MIPSKKYQSIPITVAKDSDKPGFVYLHWNQLEPGNVLTFQRQKKDDGQVLGLQITIASSAQFEGVYGSSYLFTHNYEGNLQFKEGETLIFTYEIVEGVKDSSDKLSYQEIDPAFIKLMAERMSKNKDKYPVNNWKKDINQLELLNALERHFMDLKCLMLNEPAIHNPDETIEDHLAAIGANSMMINYGKRSPKAFGGREITNTGYNKEV